MQKRVMKTRERLLEAAERLFLEKGVDLTTVDEITDSADLGKGTFYRHFQNKEEVLRILMRNAVDRLATRIREGIGKPANLQEALSGLLTGHRNFYLQRRQDFVLLFQGRMMLQLQREGTAGRDDPVTEYLAEMERQIAPYVAQTVAPEKIRKLTCALAGFVSGFLSFALIGLTDANIQSSFEPLWRVFVAGATEFLGEREN